jgi:hypothetical protein
MVEAPHQSAEVAEQADASVSKTDVRKDVRVRLPISAPGLPTLWGGRPCERIGVAIAGFVVFAVGAALVVMLLLLRSSSRAAAERRADLELESGVQRELARLATGPPAPAWPAPKLPYSVIASIWTGRLAAVPTPSGSRRSPSRSLAWATWKYRREAPYIVAAAFLSLRDEGLIRILIEPDGTVTKSLNRVWIERTDLAAQFSQMPLVEGGLLTACEQVAKKRFGKSDIPSVTLVITHFIRDSQDDVFKWLIGVARMQAEQLGLYQASSGRSAKPVYWLEHLAACDDQVTACVSRWREFSAQEPELVRELLAEAELGIRARQINY